MFLDFLFPVRRKLFIESTTMHLPSMSYKEPNLDFYYWCKIYDVSYGVVTCKHHNYLCNCHQTNGTMIHRTKINPGVHILNILRV